MTTVRERYDRMIGAMNVDGLEIPTACVKFYKHGEEIPAAVRDCAPDGLTLTSCQATRQAGFGDDVLLTADTIGCVAAAISFGLVDQNKSTPMGDSLVYTDIMKDQSGQGDAFVPPSPQDFTQGTVYACAAADRPDLALFGSDDTGRYATVDAATAAISDMMAIQPADTQAVFLYSLDFDEADVEPDVVVMAARPVELTRIIQAYQFQTGKRVTASMGGLRVVNSDLIVRPYLTGDMNVSSACLGARLIAQWDADRMGIGMPWTILSEIADGMVASQGGFPFQAYPGAVAS
ncbi:MAG: DUF169 domain-containing protein [Gemmatimonadota bacterium]